MVEEIGQYSIFKGWKVANGRSQLQAVKIRRNCMVMESVFHAFRNSLCSVLSAGSFKISSEFMATLDRFSFGVGDRFAHQAKAHLAAFQMLAKQGVHVAPVWNKSNREHTFIGSEPQSVLDAAQAAVSELGWTKSWHIDADHINLNTVDRFMSCSDFFTIDVADSIGKPAAETDVQAFINRHPELVGTLNVPDVSAPITTTRAEVETVVSKYLLAVQDAGKIYRHIVAAKGEDKIIAEVSMDETDLPQTPPELLIILALLADENVKLQTIAPKFTGRFNKGVDYVGDLVQFEKEFNAKVLGQLKSAEEIEPDIERRIMAEKRQVASDEWLARLRKKATIIYK